MEVLTAKNEPHIKKFIKDVDVAPSTRGDYRIKLEAMSKHVDLVSDQESVLKYLRTVTNPNTKSNKTSIIVKMRDVLGLPTDQLVEFRNQTKSEVTKHRRAKATENANTLMDYKTLMEHVDGMTGRDYFLNYMFASHGVRNQDVNVKYVKSINAKNKTENLISFNPKAKKPKVTVFITDYKTSGTYGPKSIEIKSQRLFDELKGLELKNNEYVFATKDGKKPTVNYMNLTAKRRSVNQYGEGRIAKILVRHLIDTKRFSELEKVSKHRGTALSTLYTSYNVLDNDGSAATSSKSSPSESDSSMNDSVLALDEGVPTKKDLSSE